ncbi:MAG TPA: CPBP family intramembrane metalloprotease [Firmicutes bacterium]|nr:CPBP family intramembrane metalloprotease [Bacillota bacterium]
MQHPQYTGPGYSQKLTLRQDASLIGVMFLLMLVLLQTVFTLIILVLSMLGIANPLASDGRYGMGSAGFLVAYMAAYALIMGLPGPVSAGIARRRIRPFSPYEENGGPSQQPLRLSSLLPALLGGLAVCVLANFATSYLMAFFSLFGIRQPTLPSYLEPTIPSLLLNILVFAVLPGLLEELLFRGYILRLLRPYGGAFAIVTTAALFALMHGNILQIPFAFLVGLACGWLALRTGRVWPAMLLHFLNNFMAQILEYIGLGQTAEQSQVTLLVVFSVIGILGMLALMFLYVRGDPLVRGKAEPAPALPLGERVKLLFSSGLFVAGIAAGVLLTLLSVLTTQLGAA